jgi:putative two-component system response regulator
MNQTLKILSVDDDFINLKLISSMLKKNEKVGTVLEAKNGLEAIEVLTQNPNISGILLDIKMPIMDVIEFLDTIQSYSQFKTIPIIILTTDETKKREALDKGACDFLVKPIREVDLAQKIDKIAQLQENGTE